MTLHAWRRTLWGMALVILIIAIFISPAQAAAHVVAEPPKGGFDVFVAYVSKLWPIIVCVAGLLLAGALLGLATRFTTVVEFKLLKGSVDKNTERLADHEKRLAKVEDHCDMPPSRLELSDDIAELSERMKGVEVGLQGLSAQGKTTNDYLHTLIQNGLAR